MKKKVKYEEKFKAGNKVDTEQVKTIVANAEIAFITMEKRGVYEVDGKELEAVQVTVYLEKQCQ